MTKYLDRRNMHTFYIPDYFKVEWNKFLINIKNDERLKQIQQEKNPRFVTLLISAGLRVAIELYNKVINKRKEKEKEVEVVNEDEIVKEDEISGQLITNELVIL